PAGILEAVSLSSSSLAPAPPVPLPVPERAHVPCPLPSSSSWSPSCGPCPSSVLPFLLINAHVVHLELRRKLSPRRIAAVGPADGEVQDKVVGLAEGILALHARVETLCHVDGVQQPVIDGELDALLVPVHPPDVELRGPLRIV